VVRPTVDTHVHFWDHGIDQLSWAFLDRSFEHPRLGGLKQLDAPKYAVDELRRDTAEWCPSKIVHVQAARSADPVVETAWLQALGDETGWPNAIVGYCDLSKPDAAEVVARHGQHPRFRGVRDLPSGTRLADPEVERGYGLVAATGTMIEVMTSWDHFDDLQRLVDRWPDAPVVLGHAGLPVERDDDYYERWQAAMTRLAIASPSMVCKVSALASGADPQWTTDSIRRWLLGCIDAFGPQRCMFASNWPIDKLFGTYPRLFEAYAEIVDAAGISPTEAELMFAGNAERVYRICAQDAEIRRGLNVARGNVPCASGSTVTGTPNTAATRLRSSLPSPSVSMRSWRAS
jgi:predicted TIM-barrel fold metal-dependent hydrolase